MGLHPAIGPVAGVRIHDIGLTAESADGHQNVEYSGALEGGYDGAAVRSLSDTLQSLVGGGSLRMTVGFDRISDRTGSAGLAPGNQSAIQRHKGESIDHGAFQFIIVTKGHRRWLLARGSPTRLPHRCAQRHSLQ